MKNFKNRNKKIKKLFLKKEINYLKQLVMSKKIKIMKK
jgi:hypothetical protein